MDSVPFVCSVCGQREDFLATIPYRHTDHPTFQLQCNACNTRLDTPAAAIAHFRTHLLPPRRFCTSPPPLQQVREQLPPPYSPTTSTIPETPDAPDAQPPRSLQLPALDRSPLERFLASSQTLQPGQPLAASTPAATNALNDLRQQLRVVTCHLVGLATATARLPVMDPDQPLRLALASAAAAVDTVPTNAEVEFRRMLTTHFPITLPRAHELQTPEIARLLLPLYEQWLADAN